MASNRIKGITIEIGGDTTGLQKALKGVDSSIKNTQSALKDVNRLLKLDPSNTELLRQKQELLKSSIADTKDRLAKLNDAYGNLKADTPEELKRKQEAVKREIIETEQSLESLEDEYKNFGTVASQQLQTVGEKIKDVGGKIENVGQNMTTKLTLPIVGLGTVATKEAADLEQAIGGVETLFGKASQTVIDNADKAYATAGISAKQYMENVTSFAASLNQALGGDVVKAAEVADMAIVDMADNANKMGTDIGSIQSAYQGFAKQNYTMLDNLKLGYGGTKSEMERLLATATELTGVKYNIDNLADVYNAIHVIQEDLGITGTTAEEASNTLSGSLASLQAELSNVAGQLGTVLLPTLTPIVNKIKEWVEAFAGLDDQQKQTIVTILSVVAAAGPVIIVIGKIVSGIGSVLGALGSLHGWIMGTMWPWLTGTLVPWITGTMLPFLMANGPIILGIGALIGAGVLLYKNWDTIKSKAQELWQKMTEVFSNIKTAISDKINGAKDTVKSAIDKIKSFFNFSWSLPKLKMPHVSISGGFSLFPPSAPHFNVDWYAKAMKNGMILNNPTIFGMMNGKLLGGGESGSETVVGTNSLMNMIRSAVGQSSTVINMTINAQDQNVYQLADIVADRITQQINRERAVYR